MLVQAEWHNAQSETPWPSESWGRRPAQPDRIQVQLGFTMFEKMHLDSGQVTNALLADYKIPGIWDVPAVMMNEALDAFQHNGPFGAKGAGESATLCLSPGPSCSVRRKCASSVLHLAKSKKFVHPLPMSRPRQAHRRRLWPPGGHHPPPSSAFPAVDRVQPAPPGHPRRNRVRCCE